MMILIDFNNNTAQEQVRKLEYIPGPWGECLERLKNNKIDLLGSIAYSLERGKFLDWVETHSPGLILMDIVIPVLNGYDAAIELRKMERFMETPILALTAYTGKEDISQFIAAGFNEVLAKPVVEKKLIEKIIEYV